MSRVFLESQVELAYTKALPLVCDDCKERVLIVVPCELSTLAALMRSFEDEHAECRLVGHATDGAT